MNKAVKRGRRESFWRAEEPGRKGRRKKEEGKSGLGGRQALAVSGKMKMPGLQVREAPGRCMRNMRLKGGFSPQVK